MTFSISELTVSANHKNLFVVLIADNRLNRTRLESETDHTLNQFVYAEHQDQIFTFVQNIKFGLIVLAFGNHALKLNNLIETADTLNYKTPVIALLRADEAPQMQKAIAIFDDCLIGSALEKQVIRSIDYWRLKIRTSEASKYIQKIHKKTKYNDQLTYIIFNKLFEELPHQVQIIQGALDKQQYSVAKDTIHKLHGSVSFCDLKDLSKIAFALESSLINKKPEAIGLLFLMLKEQIANFSSYQQLILTTLNSTNNDANSGH